jgi:hypothetical protein
MKYSYKCKNINCSLRNEEQIIEKPISEASRLEHCPECKEILVKMYSTSIKTGDGFKTT